MYTTYIQPTLAKVEMMSAASSFKRVLGASGSDLGPQAGCITLRISNPAMLGFLGADYGGKPSAS